MEYFGDKINFASERPKPDVVYASSISKNDLVLRLYSFNPIVTCANHLRDSVKNLELNLEDVFYDETNLRYSWENAIIPDEFILFFSLFFKVPEQNIRKQSKYFVNTDNESTNNSKALKINSCFQIMYNIFNNSKKNSPKYPYWTFITL